MLQGAFERLSDLGRQIRGRVIGGVAALAVDRRELGLEEQLVPADSFLLEREQRLADEGLVVVDELVGRIDRREPALHGELDQPRRRVLLPGGPVEERRQRDLVVGALAHAVLRGYVSRGTPSNASIVLIQDSLIIPSQS